jgi:hypothetical protein
VSAGSIDESSLGRGRSLAAPAFPQDDGSADAAVRALLTAGEVTDVQLARRLRPVRLLTSVVAVLDGLDAAGADKDSHMAVVSMVNERGERGLLAFTGIDTLTGWNPQARPVPALGRDVARAAIEDGCHAVVVDVTGPGTRVLTGPDLLVLADTLDLPAVDALVQAALARFTADGWVAVSVVDAREQHEVDVLVSVVTPQGSHPDGRSADHFAGQAADILAARGDVLALVPGGIGVIAGPA